jgi:hypothetical protein
MDWLMVIGEPLIILRIKHYIAHYFEQQVFAIDSEALGNYYPVRAVEI